MERFYHYLGGIVEIIFMLAIFIVILPVKVLERLVFAHKKY